MELSLVSFNPSVYNYLTPPQNIKLPLHTYIIPHPVLHVSGTLTLLKATRGLDAFFHNCHELKSVERRKNDLYILGGQSCRPGPTAVCAHLNIYSLSFSVSYTSANYSIQRSLACVGSCRENSGIVLPTQNSSGTAFPQRRTHQNERRGL